MIHDTALNATTAHLHQTDAKQLPPNRSQTNTGYRHSDQYLSYHVLIINYISCLIPGKVPPAIRVKLNHDWNQQYPRATSRFVMAVVGCSQHEADECSVHEIQRRLVHNGQHLLSFLFTCFKVGLFSAETSPLPSSECIGSCWARNLSTQLQFFSWGHLETESLPSLTFPAWWNYSKTKCPKITHFTLNVRSMNEWIDWSIDQTINQSI